MPTLYVTDTADKEAVIQGQSGQSVMEIIRDAGFEDMVAACGGNLSCATCHVIVDADWAAKVGPASDEEQDLLDGSDKVAPTSRLSCQIPMSDALDGLKLRIVQEA